MSTIFKKLKNLNAALALFSLLDLNGYAQGIDWLWAHGYGSDGINEAASYIERDVNGNLIVSGWFEGANIQFGPFTLINSNPGTKDLFLIKLDGNGNLTWAKSAGSIGNDIGGRLCTDANGNIYFTGSFSGYSINFDSISINSPTSTLYNSDVFFVKYDTDGNALWAKNYGGDIELDGGVKPAIDISGNIYLTGNFYSPSLAFDTTIIYNNGISKSDFFIAKFDSLGNVIWAKNEGGIENDRCTDFYIDVNGNLILVGQFNSPTLLLGNDTLSNSTNLLYGDLFVVKYDNSGNVIWAKSAGGNQDDLISSVEADSNGNIYFTGGFSSDSIIFGSYNLNNAGYRDVFIAKMNANGNVLWAVKIGDSNSDSSNDIFIDSNGKLFITGNYSSASLEIGNYTLTNQSLFSFSDIFIAEYDSLGNSNWATNIGGSHIDLIGNICSDSNGAKYIIGTFTSASIYFGPINLSMISTSGLYNDLFIAKFDGTNVGENKIANNNNCTIAPNPFSDFTLVTFNEEQNNTQIRLIDIIGNQVKSFVFTGKQLFIKKDNLMPGLYFVQYIDKNKQLANYKIMVN